MVPTLVTLGKFLEEKGKHRTGREIERLVKMLPTDVSVLSDGREVVLPAAEVRVGDLVLLRQGDRVPVDGVVTEGTAFVDTSAISGESMPVEVRAGDTVISGGVLSAGYLTIRAEKVGAETTFSRVLEMVRDASSSKAPVQRVADRIAGVFVPVVTGIALLTFLLWLLLSHDLDAAFRYGIGVLAVMLLLFLPAGTLRYAGGWRFLFVLFVPMLAMGLVLLKKDPALLQKRLDTKEKQ